MILHDFEGRTGRTSASSLVIPGLEWMRDRYGVTVTSLDGPRGYCSCTHLAHDVVVLRPGHRAEVVGPCRPAWIIQRGRTLAAWGRAPEHFPVGGVGQRRCPRKGDNVICRAAGESDRACARDRRCIGLIGCAGSSRLR